jgi:hypothetical protein
MNKITYKIGAGIIAAAVLTASFAPAALAANITVSGNGKKSKNAVVVNKAKVTAVSQKSKTKANTVVTSIGNTGGNKANDNTGGGNVNVGTGKVTNTTTVTVTGGSNDATLPDPCECEDENGDILISDNGRKSKNVVVVNDRDVTLVGQSTKTKANTVVTSVGNSGDNKANDNTGDGAVSVQTGEVVNTTTVSVDGGSNTLN